MNAKEYHSEKLTERIERLAKLHSLLAPDPILAREIILVLKQLRSLWEMSFGKCTKR